MRLVYFGSGAFGLPTLARLAREHDVALVVSQPARPAGRSTRPVPTPVAERADAAGLHVITPDDVDEPDAIRAVHDARPDALVVIAYGGKLGRALLDGRFAINLHASLLPRYRGAAPINWAIINGERETGVSVITVTERIDAGDVLARRATAIDPLETAGELHDRLALLGVEPIVETLERCAAGTLEPRPQDESLATRAPKLSKKDGTTGFDMPADRVRCRVHGLTPWPGCTVTLGERRLKLLRVRAEAADDSECAGSPPGTILDDLRIACAPGRLELLSVQPAGGRAMRFDAYARGHENVAGARLVPWIETA